MLRNKNKGIHNSFTVSFLLVAFFFFQSPPIVLAQDFKGPVELNGDSINYSMDGNIVTAEGNVIVEGRDVTLYCDQVKYYRDDSVAVADGNVRLVTRDGELWGSKLTYNFVTETGNFHGARIFADPYYATGKKVSKVSDTQMVVRATKITTSDYDKPKFYIKSKKMDVYPQDKMVARNITLNVFDIPVMWLPKYTQNLKDRRPVFEFTPGRSGDWGPFLLTRYYQYINDDVTAVLHTDYRHKRGYGSGLDVEYKLANMGKGFLRTYYTEDKNKDEDNVALRDERDRYKIEWRHKWDVDNKTTAIMQYYRLSDSTFLKDYFEREYEGDTNPQSFFLLTRSMPKGTLSFRADARAHNFTSDTDRLPEITYDLSSQEIGNSGFFFTNKTTFSNLTTREPDPSDAQKHTVRIDVDSEVSYPTKLGFLEVKPFVGSRETYYSKALAKANDRKIRHIVNAGTSVSTKFYKIFDLNREIFGQHYDRMRHIITPSIRYEYKDDPSLSSSELLQIDSIDNLQQEHSIRYSIENKLQVKRKNSDGGEKVVDLLRAIVGTTNRLRHDFNGEGFSNLTTDIDFKPTDWLTFYFDSSYNMQEDIMQSANFDMYINGGKKWDFEISRRYDRSVDDQISMLWRYIINPKWRFNIFTRLDIEEGELIDQEYTLTRDLHSWEMDFRINDERGSGTEILFLFRLKAFPDIGFDFGSRVGRRQSGSQN